MRYQEFVSWYFDRMVSELGIDKGVLEGFVSLASGADYEGFKSLISFTGFLEVREGIACDIGSVSGLTSFLLGIRYPFFVNDVEGRARSYLSLHDVPAAWFPTVILPLCEDVRDACLGVDPSGKLLCMYFLEQVKEKFGGLRWYDSFGFVKDDDFAKLANKTSEAIGNVIQLAEEISYQVCGSCGTSHDVWQRGGWIHSCCCACDASNHRDNADIDHILEMSGRQYWPIYSRELNGALRIQLARHAVQIRHKIDGECGYIKWNPDGSREHVDLCSRIRELGLHHCLDVACELDSRVDEDIENVPTVEELVESLKPKSYYIS